jgi:hypothetical protein
MFTCSFISTFSLSSHALSRLQAGAPSRTSRQECLRSNAALGRRHHSFSLSSVVEHQSDSWSQ